MSEGFANSILAGVGTLVRTYIQSVGFISGSVGWRISKDGTAEFNNAIVRGDVTVGPASPGARLFISSTIPAELTAYYALSGLTPVEGLFFYLNATDYYYELNIRQGVAFTFVGKGFVVNILGTQTVYEQDLISLQSLTPGVIELDVGKNTAVDLRYGTNLAQRAVTTGERVFIDETQSLNINGSLNVNPSPTRDWTSVADAVSHSYPRGLMWIIDDTASGAATAAEAIALTAPAATYAAHRAYKITLRGYARATGAALATMTMKLRDTNLVGTIRGGDFNVGIPVLAVNFTYTYEHIIANTTGANINARVLVLTNASSNANNIQMTANVNHPRYMRCDDLGLDTDYPTAVPL